MDTANPRDVSSTSSSGSQAASRRPSPGISCPIRGQRPTGRPAREISLVGSHKNKLGSSLSHDQAGQPNTLLSPVGFPDCTELNALRGVKPQLMLSSPWPPADPPAPSLRTEAGTGTDKFSPHHFPRCVSLPICHPEESSEKGLAQRASLCQGPRRLRPQGAILGATALGRHGSPASLLRPGFGGHRALPARPRHSQQRVNQVRPAEWATRPAAAVLCLPSSPRRLAALPCPARRPRAAAAR